MKNRQLKIHIIGGTGRMGTWLKQFLENQKMVVSVSGSRGGAEAEIGMANIVFICVPISKAATVIKQTTSLVRKTCLLVDMSSTQTTSAESLRKTKLSAASMHLLFGPNIESLQGQKIVFSTIKPSPLINKLKLIFEKSGAIVLEMSAGEHDRQMACVQNLTHFINIALSEVLIDEEVDLCGRISTPVFLSQLTVLNRVILQEPALLTEIQLGNKQAIKVLKRFIKNQQRLIKIIESGNGKLMLDHITLLRKRMELPPEHMRISKGKGGVYYGRTNAAIR